MEFEYCHYKQIGPHMHGELPHGEFPAWGVPRIIPLNPTWTIHLLRRASMSFAFACTARGPCTAEVFGPWPISLFK